MNTLKILLAGPRGFCAGVDRAIQIVEKALEKYGPPVYVRHEIVHNQYVVKRLESMGALFVEELHEVPTDAPVIFSAHGVPKSVPKEAQSRNMIYVDATCPLVSKVHREVERHGKDGLQTILIGHAGHPEVIGTMGQLDSGQVLLVETVEDVLALDPPHPQALAYATQTTLSVDETKDIIDVLKQRFPTIAAPIKEDICYATTNRQNAVKAMASSCDAFLVIGATNSSNSKRLVEVAKTHGCPNAHLIARATDINWDWLKDAQTLGITAGASAPEVLVQEVITACKERFDVQTEDATVAIENVEFKLPKELRAA